MKNVKSYIFMVDLLRLGVVIISLACCLWAPLFAINLRTKNTHTPCGQLRSGAFFMLLTKGAKAH